MSSDTSASSPVSGTSTTEQMEYSALWPMCEVELFSRNTFRLLELPVTATEREIAKRREWMEKAAKSKLPSPPGPARLLPRTPPPDDHELRECGYAVQDLQRRLLHEFFWFWTLDDNADVRNDEPLRLLGQGSVAEALRLWGQVLGNSERGAAARHNVAICHLLRALEAEQHILETPDAALVREAEAAWTEAYREWGLLVKEGRLWSRVANRIRAYNDASLPNGAARRLEASAAAGLLLVTARLALRYLHAGRPQDAQRHAQRLRKKPPFEATALETALRLALEPLRRSLKTRCESAESEAEKAPRHANSVAERLLDEADDDLPSLELLLESGQSVVVAERDRLAQASVNCIVAYANFTEDWEGSIPLLERSLALASSSAAKERAQANLGTVRESAEETSRWHGRGYWECGESIVQELETAHQELEANRDDSAIQTVARLLAQSLSEDAIAPQRPVFERCLAFALNHKVIRLDRAAWATFNENSPTYGRIVARMRSDRTSILMSNPDMGQRVGSLRCICCEGSIYSSFYRRTILGVEVACCVSCNERLNSEIREQERVRNAALDSLLEIAMLALELNPQSKQLGTNCNGFREQAQKLSLGIPGNTLALRRSLGIISFDDLQRELSHGTENDQREVWGTIERNYPARARALHDQVLEGARKFFAAAEAGDARGAADLLKALHVAGAFLRGKVVSEAAEPLLGRLKTFCSEAHRDMERDFLTGCEVAEKLLQESDPIRGALAQALGKGSGIAEQAGDLIVQAGLALVREFCQKTDQWKKAVVALKGLQSISCSSATQNQIRDELKRAQDNAEESNWWRGEGYFELPKAVFRHLETAREMVQSKNWEGAIQALVGLLLGKTEVALASGQRAAVEQALAYSLHGRAQLGEAPPAAPTGGQATLDLGSRT